MPWPLLTDFSEAVQNPRVCFRGTGLEGGEVAVNQRRGCPWYTPARSLACIKYPPKRVRLRCAASPGK